MLRNINNDNNDYIFYVVGIRLDKTLMTLHYQTMVLSIDSLSYCSVNTVVRALDQLSTVTVPLMQWLDH